MKPKYGEKTNLCYLETDSCIVYMKTEDSYANVEKDAETRFDASNLQIETPLAKGEKIKK